MSDYCLFGAKTLAALLKNLSNQMDGVRGFKTAAKDRANAGDIEFIHRMRVCARRLRVALPLFRECFYPLSPTVENDASFKRWMRAIRRLARSLGEARDTDVQIEAIARELEGIPPQGAAGLSRLLLRLRQKRSALQKKVVSALDRFAESSVEEEMMSRIRLLVGQASIENRTGKDEEGTPMERERAFASVKERIAHVMSFGELFGELLGSGDIIQLHEMRKSAKRLRYALEVFGPVYGDKLKSHVDGMKSLQDVLGTLHDCDVWLANLPVFMEEERERTLVYQGHTRGLGPVLRGLENFAGAKRKARDTAYASFTALWEKLCQERWWENLLKDLETS